MKTPTDAKDIKAIRDMLTGFRMQICGLAGVISEPWKTHFTDLEKLYTDQIAALTPAGPMPSPSNLPTLFPVCARCSPTPSLRC
jgi:hypothetical protein